MRKQNLVTRRFFIERPETTDKSYPGDNRLVLPESSYRRQRSAPRCRLATARGWRSSQAFGCSPIKVARELGSDRQTKNPLWHRTRRLRAATRECINRLISAESLHTLNNNLSYVVKLRFTNWFARQTQKFQFLRCLAANCRIMPREVVYVIKSFVNAKSIYRRIS